jgi:predicted transglutaminase-like cysteine proteinase
MALLHIRSRRTGTWHDARKTLRCAVAAIVALLAVPGVAVAQAQVADDSAPPCASQPSDRPVQMAMMPLNKPEPAAGPSKLEQMRMVQATGAAIIPVLMTERPADCAAAMTASAPSFAVPDDAILGTLSVSIEHTPFDRDWAGVSGRQSSQRVARTLTASGARGSGDQAAQVEAVNRWVNRSITYREDRDIYGRADYWAPASETLRRGTGDCEDFAIAKMELLSVLGIARDKMRLVVARDLVRNADHAVLVVTLAGGAVMLDNMTDQLLDARLPNDYRPIMSFSQNAKWLHGDAVQAAPPIRMAAANVTLAPVSHDIAEVLTVTPEPEIPAIAIAMLITPMDAQL